MKSECVAAVLIKTQILWDQDVMAVAVMNSVLG